MSKRRRKDKQFNDFFDAFAADLGQKEIAQKCGSSLRAVSDDVRNLRGRIFELQKCEALQSSLSISDDWFDITELESRYFNDTRRKRNATHKKAGDSKNHIAIGLIERDGLIYAKLFSNCTVAELEQIVLDRVGAKRTYYYEGMYTFEAVCDHNLGSLKVIDRVLPHDIANKKRELFEEFSQMANAPLAKQKGLPKEKRLRHIYERLFRFKHRHKDLSQLLRSKWDKNSIGEDA
jgi:predicted DNA-binding protein YlxM (UPF0122 family)